MGSPSAEPSNLVKSRSLPQLDLLPGLPVSSVSSTNQTLFSYILQKSRLPCPVKATLSKTELETTAEDVLQHLAFLVHSG